jgi:2-hydroxy-6-oxonona-2,4-dienedioate hydrolase
MKLIVILCLVLLPAVAHSQTPPAVAAQEKEMRVFGQKIVYLEAGTGSRTVIFLHGLGASSAHWRLTIPAVAASARVLAPDQLGFGKSDKPAINYRVATLVEMLDEFYAQAGVTKATLVGSSMGGWVAAAFAAAHPEKVERLVLVDAAGYSQQRWGGPPLKREDLLRMNPATLADMRALLLTVFANKALVTDLAVRAAFAQKLALGDGAVVNAFIDSVMRDEDYLDGTLGTVTAPTLLIWGEGDVLVPLAVAKAFAQDIKGATLTTLPNCGHAPLLECFAEFNETLLKFLGR